MGKETTSQDLDSYLYTLPSNERAVGTLSAIRDHSVPANSVIALYHNTLLSPSRNEEETPVDVLSDVDRFLLGRNPWTPLPKSAQQRMDALQFLQGPHADLTPTDRKQADYFASQTAKELMVQKAREGDNLLATKKEALRAVFVERIYPTLRNQDGVAIYDHDLAIDQLRKLITLGKDHLMSGEPGFHATSVYKLTESKAKRQLAGLEKASVWDLAQWIDGTVTSHNDEFTKLSGSLSSIERSLQETSDENQRGILEAEKEQISRKILGLISNLVVLRMVEEGSLALGEEPNVKVQNLYKTLVNQELDDVSIEALQSIRPNTSLDTLLRQSTSSLNRQVQAVKTACDKAKAEIDKHYDAGRQIVRSVSKDDPTTPIARYVNERGDKAMADELREMGVDLRRQTVLKKMIPIYEETDRDWKDYADKKGRPPFKSAREVIEDMWEPGMDFGGFVEKTYFSKDPSAGFFWEKFRPIVSEILGIDITQVAQEAQRKLVDQYLETSAGSDMNDLAELAIRTQLEAEQINELTQFADSLATVAHKNNVWDKLTDEFVLDAAKAYLSTVSRFIADPIGAQTFRQHFAETVLGVKPLDIVLLKCGRWISPSGRQSIVPTIGDYMTVDREGHPLLRSGHTETYNQQALLSAFSHVARNGFGADISPRVIVADTDIERALGYDPTSEMRVNMDQYRNELANHLDEGVGINFLSEVFTENPTLKQVRARHYAELRRILIKGEPTEPGDKRYFVSREHLQSAVEGVNLIHFNLEGWRRAPVDKMNDPLNPYRYLAEKFADYIAWMEYLQSEAKKNGRNTILVVGGRDPIITTMQRGGNGSVPIVTVPHYSDYH